MSSYLILGGTGFIGRNLVAYLLKEELAKKIRVADKKAPELNNMLESEEEVFNDEKQVEFIQADLARDNMVQKAFAGEKFDVVVNCAGESELGLTEECYQERVVDVSEKCAKAAAAVGAPVLQIADVLEKNRNSVGSPTSRARSSHRPSWRLPT